MEKQQITPWNVKGKVDYDKLINEFGVKRIDDKLKSKLKEFTKELHYTIQRDIAFSHRDLDVLLDKYKQGNVFYLYTGRGPSGKTHLGHLISWRLTKWFQDKFDVYVDFQMTDDEKFLAKPNLSLEQANKFAYDNALDVIALGFKKGKTRIFSNIDYAKTLYKEALRVAKHINFSLVKSVFGFDNSTNVGLIFYTAMQSVPAFLRAKQYKKETGKDLYCLIPQGIDQDPHFRITRDVLPKLNYHKPACIHTKFFPGLKSEKMSASSEDVIFTTDSEEEVKKKVSKALTGGKETLKLQRELGGNPDKCHIFKYLEMFFEDNDNKLKERKEQCLNGSLTCGECKNYLINKINKYLNDFNKKREKAKDLINDFFVKD